MKLKAKINKKFLFAPFKMGERVTVEDTISMKTGCLVVTSNETYSSWHLRPDFVTFINPPISPLIKLSLEVAAYEIKIL